MGIGEAPVRSIDSKVSQKSSGRASGTSAPQWAGAGEWAMRRAAVGRASLPRPLWYQVKPASPQGSVPKRLIFWSAHDLVALDSAG